MPQLNPAPWFLILVFSWAVFLTVIPSKVINYEYPNEPTPQSAKPLEMHPWGWPWQ